MSAQEVSKLQEDINNLKGDLQELSKTIKEMASTRLSDEKTKFLADLPLEELKTRVDAMKVKGKEGIDGVEKQIVKNPFKSTAMTFGLGFLVAWIFSTKR